LTSAVVGVVAYSSGGQSEQQHQQAISANKTTEGGDQPAQQYVRDHAGVPAFAERFISNPEPAGESEKEQRDLAAQENTATWAFWVVVFSAGQLALSAGGLVALLVTIRQGRKALKRARTANRISEKTAERELRAYLGFDEVVFDQHTGKVEFRIKNFGQTPAREVRAYTRFGSVSGEIFTFPHPIGIIDPGHFGLAGITLSDADWRHLPTTPYWQVAVLVEYDDAFAGEWKRTASYCLKNDFRGGYQRLMRLDLVAETAREAKREERFVNHTPPLGGDALR
jgi:hypothetical protein